uniref:Protein kinase domain-containing protein n=1 Tax=Arundo donax TaxID=35708 RepID=A0A0A9FEQ7_ARUDO
MENTSGRISDGPWKRLPFKLIQRITNCFSEERKLGCGTFGQVYKGVLDDGKEIAVKKLRFMPGINDRQFQNEIENLKRLKHKNIVRLLGFCDESEETVALHEGKLVRCEEIHRALCLEYMPNGSLGKLLSGEYLGKNWPIRYSVIKGICEGLKYLHEGLEKPIYHFDLKPDNILLDEEMVPKIADFGLSRLIGEENTKKTVTPLGTHGYWPPEFINSGIISKEYDIFSLGVIITKIIVGNVGYSSIADMEAPEFIDHVYEGWRKSLHEKPKYASLDADCKQVRGCIEIAVNCMDKDRRKRPKIKDIVSKLDNIEHKENNSALQTKKEPNFQQNQLMGPQDYAMEIQQYQRLPVQSNDLLDKKQTQQMSNQQSLSLHHSQQMHCHSIMPSLQQQQLLGTVPRVSNIQQMYMQQQTNAEVQQPPYDQQQWMVLMQSQSQQNQLQTSQQVIMSQLQAQPIQLAQLFYMLQHPFMQQKILSFASTLIEQINVGPQMQYTGLQEVPSSTPIVVATQTGHSCAHDFREELYKMIKSLKDQYFAELNDLHSKISMKLEYVDAHMPCQKPTDNYEKMKYFKIMLERLLHFLQINKANIEHALRKKLPFYERQIIAILNSQRRKPVQTQGQQQFLQSAGQAPSSNISQQQQSSKGLQEQDIHTNLMPQASFPGMITDVQSHSAAGVQHVPAPKSRDFGVPTEQRNVADSPQAGSNMEAAQGSNCNSAQHNSMSGPLQQVATNAQHQSGNVIRCSKKRRLGST